MNYTQEVKEEIEPKLPKSGTCCKAFLSAVTKSLGSMSIFKEGARLEYDFKDNESVFTIMKMLRDYFDCEVECKIHHAEGMSFTLLVDNQYANTMLEKMNITHMKDDKLVFKDVDDLVREYKEESEIKAFIQGLFICCGGVYIPDDVNSKGGYHIELNIIQEDFAIKVVDLLAKCNLEFSIAERNSTYSVYAKRKNVVCDFLTFIEATDASLYLNDIMLRREINNDINRLTNIEMANTDRKYISNSKYISAIEVVQEVIGLDDLEPKLSKIAKARLEDHDESMGELAERLGISKSSVSRALTKLVEMAKRIEKED